MKANSLITKRQRRKMKKDWRRLGFKKQGISFEDFLIHTYYKDGCGWWCKYIPLDLCSK